MRSQSKKFVGFIALVVLSSTSVILHSNLAHAQRPQPEMMSGKQKVTFGVGGDCADLYDEYQTDYVMNEGEDCYFTVRVVPAKPLRTVALQYQSTSGRWITEAEARTNAKGIAILRPVPTDSEGYFLCDYYTYRLGVARLGNAKALLSSTFEIEFVSSDEDCY